MRRIGLVAAMLVAVWSGQAQAAGPRRPALAVVVVVDQLSAEFLERQAPELRGGLATLLRESVSFQDARFGATPTVTAAGHAALATGTYGSVNGIPANDWIDRASGKEVYCVEDERHRVLGREPRPYDGTSPRRLLSPTLGDALKWAAPRAKVVSIALKDRSAILSGGHRPDAAVWFDKVTGRYLTSDYYADRVPAFADAENRRLEKLQETGFTWRLGPASPGGKGGAPGKEQGSDLGSIEAGLPAERFGEQFGFTGAAVRSLLALARDSVGQESLGADDVPDLLVVSISSHDYVLHRYGPDSAQAAASAAAIDAELREFLGFLDAKVGRERLVVALTSDHGGAPLPEVAKAAGQPAGRLDPTRVAKAIEAGLNERFKRGGRWVAGMKDVGIYLDANGEDEASVQRAAAEALLRVEGIALVLRRSDRAEWLTTPLGRAALRAYSPANGPDLVLAVAPYWVWGATGTDHGTPYAYDARVPLLIRATGKRAAKVFRGVEPIDLAPTLAALLGVPPPGTSEGKLLVEVLH